MDPAPSPAEVPILDGGERIKHQSAGRRTHAIHPAHRRSSQVEGAAGSAYLPLSFLISQVNHATVPTLVKMTVDAEP